MATVTFLLKKKVCGLINIPVSLSIGPVLGLQSQSIFPSPEKSYAVSQPLTAFLWIYTTESVFFKTRTIKSVPPLLLGVQLIVSLYKHKFPSVFSVKKSQRKSHTFYVIAGLV